MRSLALRCQGLASGQAGPAMEAVALARWARLLVEQAGADAWAGRDLARLRALGVRLGPGGVAAGGRGLTNGAPARRLSISPHTVSTRCGTCPPSWGSRTGPPSPPSYIT